VCRWSDSSRNLVTRALPDFSYLVERMHSTQSLLNFSKVMQFWSGSWQQS
jgi:hypothetical protein